MRDWKSILVSAEDSDDLSEALETLALDNGVSLLYHGRCRQDRPGAL